MLTKLPDGVQPLELTQDKVRDIWFKMNGISGIMDDFHKDRFDLFLGKLQDPNTVWLERTDGNGILYLTDVIRGLSAYGHILYWDRRLRGRESFTLECMKWLMRTVPLGKINVFLPEFSKAAEAFVQRLGFRKEGTLRRWSISQGKPFDMMAYGILYEEAMSQEVQDGLQQRTEDNHSSSRESGLREPANGDNEPVLVGAEHTANRSGTNGS